MRFLVLPFGQSAPLAHVGVGELVAYQWAIEDIAADQAWEIVGHVEPPLLNPAEVRITSVGPGSEVVRFEATQPGRAVLRFWAEGRQQRSGGRGPLGDSGRGLVMRTTSYHEAGVKAGNEIPGFRELLKRLAPTFGYAAGARPIIDFGYYANVIPVGPNLGVAISTDGVGTKILVAQALQKYDTIGIDCVAMNANDVICVGARPLSMVDYIAVEEADDYLLEEIGKGLEEGARQAGISIPGGELAQVKDMIRGEHPGTGFDLVGTCIGTVDLDKVITGKDLSAGDAIIGLASSGVHSNGLTLARKHFDDLGEYVPELSEPVGVALLRPTVIYVRAAMAMLEAGIRVKAFAHITSDGFLNLSRVQADVSFEITDLPLVPPIFDVIRRRGEIPPEEMYRVFNMGIGFVAVVDPADEARALAAATSERYNAMTIGRVIQEQEKRVHLRGQGLVGKGTRFQRV